MLAPFDELLKETFYEGLISVFIGRKAEPNAACYSLPVFRGGGGCCCFTTINQELSHTREQRFCTTALYCSATLAKGRQFIFSLINLTRIAPFSPVNLLGSGVAFMGVY